MTASPLSEEGKINVSWTVPRVSSGSSITGYSILYKVSSNSGPYLNISNPGSSATNTVISGLRIGEDYIIRVAAKTELGIGNESYGEGSTTTYGGECDGDLNINVTRYLCLRDFVFLCQSQHIKLCNSMTFYFGLIDENL